MAKHRSLPVRVCLSHTALCPSPPSRCKPGTRVRQDLSPPGPQDFGLDEAVAGLAFGVPWLLAGARRQDQPSPGFAWGKKEVFGCQPWLHGCSPLPLHLSRNSAWKRSSLRGEPRCSHPSSTAFPGVHCLPAKHRARLGNDLFAENQQALPRRPPAPSHRLLPEPPLQRDASLCPRCWHPQFAPEGAGSSISGQTGGLGHQSLGAERELGFRVLQSELHPSSLLQCFFGAGRRLRCPEEDQGPAKGGGEEAEARRGWERGAAGSPQPKPLDVAWSWKSQIRFQACFSHGSSRGEPWQADRCQATNERPRVNCQERLPK